MYIPKHFEETDVAVLAQLIEAHSLGTWITQGDGELIVNHLPFLFDATRGPHGTLFGHVARANPAWRAFSRTIPSIVVFHGPNAYVTPSWYPTKREHGKVVPTWNYVVVHAHGVPVTHDDKGWLLEHVSKLADTHEARQREPWKVTDAPAEFVRGLLEHIVGIEIPLTKLVGKWKVNQNRSRGDRLGAVAGLAAAATADALAMAELVRERTASDDAIRNEKS